VGSVSRLCAPSADAALASSPTAAAALLASHITATALAFPKASSRPVVVASPNASSPLPPARRLRFNDEVAVSVLTDAAHVIYSLRERIKISGINSLIWWRTAICLWREPSEDS